MRVRVVKSNDASNWYAERIGEDFEVLAEELIKYRIKTKRPSIGHFYILFEDCEIIPEVSE